MANYFIVGHIKRYQPDLFMAVVNAIPAEGRCLHAADEIGETVPSLFQAKAALHRLSVVMGARIRAQGGTVQGVEI